MRKLVINSKKFGKHTVKYDTQDHALISSFTWHLERRTVNNIYATSFTYDASSKTTTMVKMHRLILGLDNPKIQVDHINGDGLDNRRKNLRITGYNGNSKNRRIYLSNTSGFKGVSFHKRDKKYQAYIALNGIQHNLGYFNSAMSAAKAYNVAAIKHHGEFARLNKV